MSSQKVLKKGVFVQKRILLDQKKNTLIHKKGMPRSRSRTKRNSRKNSRRRSKKRSQNALKEDSSGVWSKTTCKEDALKHGSSSYHKIHRGLRCPKTPHYFSKHKKALNDSFRVNLPGVPSFNVDITPETLSWGVISFHSDGIVPSESAPSLSHQSSFASGTSSSARGEQRIGSMQRNMQRNMSRMPRLYEHSNYHRGGSDVSSSVSEDSYMGRNRLSDRYYRSAGDATTVLPPGGADGGGADGGEHLYRT